MMLYIIIGIALLVVVFFVVRHQRRLRLRAHLMREAIRNRDFQFRLPTDGLLPGERAMQETLNKLGESIRQQVSKSEVETWERLTRVLTHEIMNATAPITSISQSLMSRQDVKGTPLEGGVQAIYETSRHLSEFVANYRKMSELEKPVLGSVRLSAVISDISKAYPQLEWSISVPADILVEADAGMLRQVLVNLVKNAVEADAKKIVIDADTHKSGMPSTDWHVCLSVGNDGMPIPVENRQSLFVPFFTTKRGGSGIGLSLSRRMMIQQGGMLDLADKPLNGCHTIFLVTIPAYK